MNTRRNPFPKIGKVIKYEFKHSSKILLPLYGILLLLGLLTGLSFNKTQLNNIFNFNTVIEDSTANNTTNVITGILFTLVCIFITTITIITIVTLAKRFKQGMLEEESYINLSLPFTISEHLWGRFIIDICWIILNYLVIAVTLFFCIIKIDFSQLSYYINQTISQINLYILKENLSFGLLVKYYIISSLVGIMWLISLIFFGNSLSLLFKNMKGFVKFILIVLIIYINLKVINNINPINSAASTISFFYNYMIKSSGVLLIFTACYFAATQLIFTKKLNLD